MKPRMCILYLGVDFDPDDTSGDGGCLNYLAPDQTCLPCKDAIGSGKCPKNRKKPQE